MLKRIMDSECIGSSHLSSEFNTLTRYIIEIVPNISTNAILLISIYSLLYIVLLDILVFLSK